MKISIVLGAGFGDEGKGKVTNHLSKSNPAKSLVIRFNGGHQAGHTVVHEGIRHVFSSFGSGTLNGTPTFWSRYCTMFPPAVLREFEELNGKGVSPVLYVDPLSMIVTPFDISRNRYEERLNSHGTVGSGFGKTVERHETLENSYRIFAKDLSCEWVLRQKLKMLRDNVDVIHHDTNIDMFIEQCLECSKVVSLKTETEVFEMKGRGECHYIFEGAQGILLDREHGIFPHVTRSATTSKNAMEMINRHNLVPKPKDVFSTIPYADVYYLTRCYQTRHGNGPLLGEEFPIELINNEAETNVTNPWQGKFRKAPLSIDLLKYAIDTDSIYHDAKVVKKVVVSHLDQFESDIPVLLCNQKYPIPLPHETLIREIYKHNPSIWTIKSSYSEEM